MLQLNAKQSAGFVKLCSKVEKLHKEYNELKKEIEQALLSLKTFAQIQKHLPEAVPFLPKSESLALMVNYDDVRAKINAA